MNHQEFVEHNVRQQLLKEGFSAALANIGANKAVQHYRRLSQASKRGDLRRLLARGAAVGREVTGNGTDQKTTSLGITPAPVIWVRCLCVQKAAGI
ncbi:hypothetical protein ACS25C_03895 [Dickeya undicola]|uniref:hypothetical protein n=1 Tax=Dickeya undicola TaxID=1577887 RepID=UPI003F2580CB